MLHEDVVHGTSQNVEWYFPENMMNTNFGLPYEHCLSISSNSLFHNVVF